MGASIHIGNPLKTGNHSTLWYANNAGYGKYKHYVDARLVDTIKLYWNQETETLSGGPGHSITITWPAGYTYLFLYLYPEYKTLYSVRNVNKEVSFLKPFYEDGIEDKLGGERIMLGD